MNMNTLLLSFICVLTASCASNEVSDTTPPICSNKPPLDTQFDPCSNPSASLSPALMYYKMINQRYPDSPEELSKFLQSVTNAPYFNPEDFKTLEFEHAEDGSMKVNYEFKSGSTLGSGSGTLVMHPSVDTMVELGQALTYFKEMNDRDPDTSSELYDFLSTDTNAPYLNPIDFKVLEFDHAEDGSLITNCELKGDPALSTMTGTSTGAVIIDPSEKETQQGD